MLTLHFQLTWTSKKQRLITPAINAMRGNHPLTHRFIINNFRGFLFLCFPLLFFLWLLLLLSSFHFTLLTYYWGGGFFFMRYHFFFIRCQFPFSSFPPPSIYIFTLFSFFFLPPSFLCFVLFFRLYRRQLSFHVFIFSFSLPLITLDVTK